MAIEYKGMTYSSRRELFEACRNSAHTDVTLKLFFRRFSNGWDVERALTERLVSPSEKGRMARARNKKNCTSWG